MVRHRVVKAVWRLYELLLVVQLLLLLLLLMATLVGVARGCDWRWRASHVVVIGLAMVAADRHWRCVCYLRLLEIKQFSL